MNFDICIPSYNSLEYLKLAVDGIRKHSSFKHRIYVHDNGSEDGTLDWLKENKIDYTHTKTNEGFCGINHVLKRSTSDHVMMFNSDMIPLPEWDMQLYKQQMYFKRLGLKEYTISSCLIEPTGYNPEYDIDNCGTDADNYDEKKLLQRFQKNRAQFFSRQNTVQYSHPILLPRALLVRSGYLDVDYFPGWAVDHDIAARAYYRGNCRHFVMVGASRVYHFSSKTFKKLPDNIRSRHGEDIFLNKWGMSVRAFRNLIGIQRPYENVHA